MDSTRGPFDPSVAGPRARWRAAEDRLYPTLITNPANYQRALTQVQAVVEELRRRGDDVAVLLAAETEPDQVLAAACPEGVGLPVDLLMGVACGMRDRELTAHRERVRVSRVVVDARASHAEWATLRGPATPAELADGSASVLHLESGTVLTATVDPWSGDPPFALEIAAADGAATQRTFTDRAEWLAEYERWRADPVAALSETVRMRTT
ncbi:hypothetical protein [Pseudonocardia spinosispora]|uniref:hypothetical protein n=1 Tax=Pseudonocardia spinosispora TaxID=103441 RepID=UPI000402E031|nr:hypothetical protein [Pseudonocardia spinosispora]